MFRLIPALLFFTCPLASFSNLASQPVQQGTDRAFALARKHNVKVAFGTDMLGTGNNGALLSLAGPRYPLPAEVGVIRAGAVADLLLVDGDPTADLSLIADPENNFLLIIKQGKV